MLTKEYRFSLIFPLLLICSFDLPDSTIQIIREVPVFHATNVMPKLNQTKVLQKQKKKKTPRKKKGSRVKELFLTLIHQMAEESRPQEEVPAKYPTSLAPSEGILYSVGTKYLPATAKPLRIGHF